MPKQKSKLSLQDSIALASGEFEYIVHEEDYGDISIVTTNLGARFKRTKNKRKPDMNMREFSEQNKMRCQSTSGFNHKLNGWSLSDWLTATAGELGEAANVIKKLNRIRDDLPGNSSEDDIKKLKHDLAMELADTYIYLDLLAQAADIDLPNAIKNKFDIVSERIGYHRRLKP